MSDKFSKAVVNIRKGTVCVAFADLQNDPNGNYANIITSGTGFFVSADGWLLTSLHVMQYFNEGKQKILASYKANEQTVTFSESLKVAHSFPEIGYRRR